MNKLTRYLVILAGLALAMLMTVPAAVADEEVGPNSHACKEAKESVAKAKGGILLFLRRLHDVRTDTTNAPVVNNNVVKPPAESEWVRKDWDKKEWTEEALLEVLNAIINHPKAPNQVKVIAERLKGELHKAREDRHDACTAPGQPNENKNEHEKSDNTNNANTVTFTQVGEVPAGAPHTGGGPA